MASSTSFRWGQMDVEQRLGFKSGRFTSVNLLLTFLIGLVFAGSGYLIIFLADKFWPASHILTGPFFRLNNLPTLVPLVIFFSWSVVMLLMKKLKLGVQKKAMAWAVVPANPDFVLTESTAQAVLERIHNLVDEPKHFILLNRIERSLSNLHHLGQVSEVSSVLRGQAEDDENAVAGSFTLLQGFVWAMPVLGFIGTSLGLSMAIRGFGSVLGAQGGSLDSIKSNLVEVTKGLGSSFETTLVALVFALSIQVWMSFRQRAELEFLDACNDYCQSYVISKLRLTRNTESYRA